MAKDITLELSAAEALMVLDPIQAKALTASRLAAQSSGDAKEIAELSARICGAVAQRIVDGLYDDQAFEDDPEPFDINREGLPEFNGAYAAMRRRDLEDEVEFGLV